MNIYLFGILLLQAGGLLSIVINVLDHEWEHQTSSTKFDHYLLKEIHLSSTAYENCKINAEEILLDGKMYDVDSVEFSENEGVSLLVFADLKEDSIRDEMINIQKKNKDPKNSGNNSVQEDLCDPICIHLDINYSLLRLASQIKFSNGKILPLSPGISGIFIPPPEVELV